MQYTTTVKVYVEGEPDRSIPCAIVYLCDRDLLTPDDHLGMNITNTFGEATFWFREEDYLDLDDRIGGVLPELYVKVFDSEGACVYTTRSLAQRNVVPPRIDVAVPRALAEKHGLL